MTIATESVKNADTSGVVVTAVAAPDVESQQPKPAAVAASSPPSDENAGKGLGIAMFVLILVGLIFNWLIPIVSFVCIIAAIVLASAITCGCCCASDLGLKPHVKKFSTATLLSLVLIFVCQIIYLIAVMAQMTTEAANTGTISSRSVENATTGAIVVGVLSLIFNVMALVFAGLFTWGRGCCAPSS